MGFIEVPPGRSAVAVAYYCPSRWSQLEPKYALKHSEQLDEYRCTNLEDICFTTSHKKEFLHLSALSLPPTRRRRTTDRTWTAGYTTGPISFGPLQLENEDTEGGPGRHNQQWA